MRDERKKDDLRAQKHIGKVIFTLHTLVSAFNQTVHLKLENSKALVQVVAEVMEEEHHIEKTVSFKVNCDLTAKHAMVFFVVWKWMASGKYKPIYKSETKVPEQGLAEWDTVSIDTQ